MQPERVLTIIFFGQKEDDFKDDGRNHAFLSEKQNDDFMTEDKIANGSSSLASVIKEIGKTPGNRVENDEGGGEMVAKEPRRRNLSLLDETLMA